MIQTYRLNASLAAEAEDEIAPDKEFGKVGSCDGLAKVKLSSMITLTTLPLAGGQGGDEASSWPEDKQNDPTLPNTNQEDRGLSTEQDDVYDVNYLNLF